CSWNRSSVRFCRRDQGGAFTAILNNKLGGHMKPALIAAATLLALAPLSLSFAQNSLPTTRVTAPKPVVRPAAYVPVPSSGNYTANSNPTNPNAVIDPTTPNVRAGDWNAPGAVNLHYMTDAQFAAFETAHPTAVIVSRCYIGQDPDLQIRSRMRGAQGRSGNPCAGGS